MYIKTPGGYGKRYEEWVNGQVFCKQIGEAPELAAGYGKSPEQNLLLAA